jgi:hypothetical protein
VDGGGSEVSDSIDTAVPSRLPPLEGLNDDQLDAVARLRELSQRWRYHPYTLGALAAGSSLERLHDGKRLRDMSPADRELMKEEVREVVYPNEPLVVVVWSAFCERHGIEPKRKTGRLKMERKGFLSDEECLQRFEAGTSVREIARADGVRENAVYQRIYRAQRKRAGKKAQRPPVTTTTTPVDLKAALSAVTNALEQLRGVGSG